MKNSKYRLKKEARHFFNIRFHTPLEAIGWWNMNNISIELLDEAPAVYIEFGHKDNETPTTRRLSSWNSSDKEAHFRFTLTIPEMESSEYENLNVSDMMDCIQKAVDKFIKY